MVPEQRTLVINYWMSPMYPLTRCFLVSEEMVGFLEDIIQTSGIRVLWRNDDWRGDFAQKEELCLALKALSDTLGIPHDPSLWPTELIVEAVRRLQAANVKESFT
jgi:hypothetical protein